MQDASEVNLSLAQLRLLGRFAEGMVAKWNGMYKCKWIAETGEDLDSALDELLDLHVLRAMGNGAGGMVAFGLPEGCPRFLQR